MRTEKADGSSSSLDATLYWKIKREAESGGYHLNPDHNFVMDLMSGLNTNLTRYGYMSCPCRLASGDAGKDRDIMCPCYYRDDDLNDFGCCYCCLYVSKNAVSTGVEFKSIPERRTSGKRNTKTFTAAGSTSGSISDLTNGLTNIPANVPTSGPNLSYPVWRCNVCGYLCARNAPPDSCPICMASADRFERFL